VDRHSVSRLGHVAPSDRLSRQLSGPWRLLLRELGAFGSVGAVCLVLDLALFQFLYATAGVEAVTAKLVATLVSMTAAFLGHRYWSFSRRARTGLRREYVRFVAINGLTLLMGLAIIAFVRHALGQESALVLQAANVASIGVGTVTRWLMYRRWVFTVSPSAGVAPGGTSPAAVPVQAARAR
jgi:putative flippase GtrA